MVSLQDRWVGLGMTGSGKTTFAKQLIEKLRESYPAARVYLLDSKGQGDFDTVHNATMIKTQEAPDALRTPGAIQIWSPPLDDIKEYDKWFVNILKHRQPSIVLVDELASIGGKTGNSFPLGYFLLQKQGRGLDISLITLTQEAAYIPRQVMGQASHLLRFRLLDEYDSRKADKLLRRVASERGKEPSHQYGFFYRRVDRPSPVYEYKNWQDFFKTV